jgi:hypothetical protein
LPGGETVKVTRQDSSYTVTLGEGSKWDPLDTVIRLKVRQPPRENLALYKPVYFSSSDETTTLQANAFWHAGLTDGKMNKAWSSKDKIDANHPQWVTVDLLNQQSISRVTLWAYDQAYPVDFTVEVSTDNKKFEVVASYQSQSFTNLGDSLPAKDGRLQVGPNKPWSRRSSAGSDPARPHEPWSRRSSAGSGHTVWQVRL